MSSKKVNSSLTHVYLDIAGIDMSNVQFKQNFTDADWINCTYTVNDPNPNLGQLLNITLPTAQPLGNTFLIKTSYLTNKNQTATSWMTKEQTACKSREYLFTQCEDIYCRSIAPMQDTPAVRITYEAHVTAPNGFDVRMSANRTNKV